jgi:hypothetical protein
MREENLPAPLLSQSLERKAAPLIIRTPPARVYLAINATAAGNAAADP